MRAASNFQMSSMRSGERRVSETFKKTVIRDAAIVFASGLLIAGGLVTVIFFLLDLLVH